MVAENRPALADGGRGRDLVEVIYAAYVAAEEGRRIDLSGVADRAAGAAAVQPLAGSTDG